MPTGSLPFILQQVQAIKWEPGATSCIVTYRDSSGVGARTKKVSLAVMEEIRSNFKRFLVCATTCSVHAGYKNKAVADCIKRWDRQIAGRSDTHYLLDKRGAYRWLDMSRFTFAMSTPRNGSSNPLCTLYYSAGDGGTFDPAILDASCPGFTEFCKILCVDSGLNNTEVFQYLGDLPRIFSYEVLEANAQNFAVQLRACAPLGLPMAEMLGVLKSSVSAETAASLPLPDLSMGVT
jgi:hypothetical protein